MSYFAIDQSLTEENKSTQEYRRVEYQVNGNNLSAGDYDIEVKDDHNWFLPSETLLQVDFDTYKEVSKLPNTHLKETDRTALDTPLALFENFTLTLNEKGIGDSDIKYPAIQTMMQLLPVASQDYNTSVQSVEGFYPMLNKCGLGAPVPIPANGLAGGAVSMTAHTEYDNASAQTLWFPDNDKLSPVQYSFIKAAASATGSHDGRIRRNIYYDGNFVQSCKDLSGKCSYFIPLRQLYPFFGQALSKANKGLSLKLKFKRLADDTIKKAFYTNGVEIPNLTVNITKVSLWAVQMVPSTGIEASLAATLAKNMSIERVFEQPQLTVSMNKHTTETSGVRIQINNKSARPVRAYVAFRLSGRHNARNNSHNFEGLNVKEFHLRVNSSAYPSEYYNLEAHPTRVLSDLHKMVMATGDYTDGSLVSYRNWVDGPCRIYGIDLSAVSEDIFAREVSDVELRYDMSAAPPGLYDVFVLLCTEKRLQQVLSDRKMNIRL